MKRIFEGEPGRWLAYECLPPTVLAVFVWPLVQLASPKAPGSWWLGFLTTFSAGDLVAIAICFLLPILSRAMQDTRRTDHSLGAEAVVSLLIYMLGYAAMKVYPADVPETMKSEVPVRAYFYVALSLLAACRTTAITYRSKAT
jgi:hypothetical protein